MAGDGYEVEAGDLRVQANRDWTDAAELNGAAADLNQCNAPAAAGAADSPDLTEAMEYALSLFRNVFWEFSDATAILGSSESVAASRYDNNEAESSSLYGRMGMPR
ncbi:hypothetical protein [Georgenia faecalis]|uniref:Uncharacterized protein n=1 Tax=Georgenia faecalis TaxID=2483799 RepID=A0ABV9D5H7_9MICO|nr:hypothetical protein [Georgenia faecalis]